MSQLEGKESYPLPDSVSEKIQRRQKQVMEAQRKLDKEREHLNDIFETTAEFLDIDAPPERVQFNPEKGQLIELAPKSELEKEESKEESQDDE